MVVAQEVRAPLLVDLLAQREVELVVALHLRVAGERGDALGAEVDGARRDLDRHRVVAHARHEDGDDHLVARLAPLVERAPHGVVGRR